MSFSSPVCVSVTVNSALCMAAAKCHSVAAALIIDLKTHFTALDERCCYIEFMCRILDTKHMASTDPFRVSVSDCMRHVWAVSL